MPSIYGRNSALTKLFVWAYAYMKYMREKERGVWMVVTKKWRNKKGVTISNWGRLVEEGGGKEALAFW